MVSGVRTFCFVPVRVTEEPTRQLPSSLLGAAKSTSERIYLQCGRAPLTVTLLQQDATDKLDSQDISTARKSRPKVRRGQESMRHDEAQLRHNFIPESARPNRPYIHRRRRESGLS